MDQSKRKGNKLVEKTDVTNPCCFLRRRKGWKFAGPQSLDFLFYSYLLTQQIGMFMEIEVL